MRLSVKNILSEAQSKMSSDSVFLYYQFSNISIKAEAEALLSVSVPTEEGDLDIEKTADIAIPCEDKFIIIPKKPTNLFKICKAIALEHPEYKIERKVYNDDGDVNNTDLDSILLDETAYSQMEDMVICCTMPEINEDRRDVALDLVSGLYSDATASIDNCYAEYQVILKQNLVHYPPQELDEADKELDVIYNRHKSECARYKKEKELQIE